MKVAVGFACGILFATGLGISGMLKPHKVIGFLDFFGEWDPTLLGVMAGAIPVYLLAWIARRGRRSRWGSEVPAKANHVLDGRLFLDRLSRLKRDLYRARRRKLDRQGRPATSGTRPVLI